MEALTLIEIANATAGSVYGESGGLSVSAVSTDSRKIKPGSLFVPIIGESFDGHDFIEAAVKNGAAAFISSKETEAPVPYILVKDTRRALGDLAAYYRSLFKIPIAAVTGSSGKTSVKNGIAAVLGKKYKVLKTEGNLNNDIGLPLTIFEIDRSHEAAVLELGMNALGEISYLSKIAKPDIGVITNVGTAHIERLGSREGILRAKLEIIDGMSENGTLVLNYDNDMLRTIENNPAQNIIWVSAKEEADVYAKNIISVNETPGAFETGFVARPVRFTVCYKDKRIEVEIPIGEAPLITNALMTAAAGFLLGVSDEGIKVGIEQGGTDKARLEFHKTKAGGVLINDCYNANAESMKLALDALSRYNIEKIAILGDMAELGEYAPALHREVGEYAYKRGVNVLIAIGDNARYYKQSFDELNLENRKSYYFQTKQDFFDAEPDLSGKKAILIKASRVMRLEDIFNNQIGE